MKTAIKLTGILATALIVSGTLATNAVAQNTDAIDQARSIAKSLQQKQANDSNAALDAAGVKQSDPQAAPQTTPAVKPAPGAPAPAVKPAVIPGSKPAPVAQAAEPKTAAASAASGQHNQLQNVNVVQNSDSIEIEISSSEAVTPRVSKLSSPARVVVELPETVVASSQNKIPVGNGGVKGVRIGMDGKTPPTTSIVVDLEKALAYDMNPGADGKLVLTLHTQGGAAAVAKSEAKAETKSEAKSETKSNAPSAKVVAGKPATAAQLKTVAASPAAVSSKPAAKAAEAKVATAAKQSEKPAAQAAASASASDVSKIGDNAKPKAEDKKWAMNGRRDPFFSPVVQQNGSGCSTGKKCLEIGNINLRGVVKSESGFIAVVTNNLNKAYFLRENDPVFNGYVVRITGDSVVFQETVQDKLGKPFTREVVKRIFTPAV
jgi:Tfp pilus assembly protein PilP